MVWFAGRWRHSKSSANWYISGFGECEISNHRHNHFQYLVIIVKLSSNRISHFGSNLAFHLNSNHPWFSVKFPIIVEQGKLSVDRTTLGSKPKKRCQHQWDQRQLGTTILQTMAGRENDTFPHPVWSRDDIHEVSHPNLSHRLYPISKNVSKR